MFMDVTVSTELIVNLHKYVKVIFLGIFLHSAFDRWFAFGRLKSQTVRLLKMNQHKGLFIFYFLGFHALKKKNLNPPKPNEKYQQKGVTCFLRWQRSFKAEKNQTKNKSCTFCLQREEMGEQETYGGQGKQHKMNTWFTLGPDGRI